MAFIAEINEQERPREKAKRYGLKSLSSRELLAIFLRTGTKGKGVLDVADDLLCKAGTLKGLGRMRLQDLKAIRGISDAKALEMLACFELSRRVALETVLDRDVVTGSEALVSWLKKEIGTSAQENFLAVYLDTANHILDYRILFIGTLASAQIYPREIMKEALLLNSAGIILVHNHPGGTPYPSKEDRLVTKELVKAAKLLGVEITDHIIVTEDSYFSFRHSGFLPDVEPN